MLFRTISSLVPLPGAPDALEAAIDCARLWDSHLDVVCVAPVLLDPSALTPDGLSMFAVPMSDFDAGALRAVEDRVTRRLTGEPFGWAVEAIAPATSDGARRAAAMARFSELSVLPNPFTEDTLSAETMFEATLFTARIPVLLPHGDTAPKAESVAVAWDGSPQAMAAIRATMPLLEAAQSVQLISIVPARTEDAAGDFGTPLAMMLTRRGVACNVVMLSRGSRGVAEVLTDHAAKTGVDLMVMGAYGHSRLREALLGGVTRQMVRDQQLPLLLAH